MIPKLATSLPARLSRKIWSEDGPNLCNVAAAQPRRAIVRVRNATLNGYSSSRRNSLLVRVDVEDLDPTQSLLVSAVRVEVVNAEPRRDARLSSPRVRSTNQIFIQIRIRWSKPVNGTRKRPAR